MKNLKICLFAGALIMFNACTTNMDGVVSATDIAALEAMNTSFTAAGEYNNSLAAYISTTGITNDSTCLYYDSMFHQSDSIFNENHMMYSHNNKGDDHSKNSWSMGSGWMTGNGGMMGTGNMGHFNTSGCTSNNLNLMDSLMTSHTDYHPGN